jgi:rod shape-determining protein MreD
MNAPWQQMGWRERAGMLADQGWRAAIPALTVFLALLLGSRLPLVASIPMLPDLGLPLLIAWRLYQPTLMPIWAALPLGLAADVMLVQPLGVDGTAWPLALAVMQILERRFIGRTFAVDWGVAAVAVLVATLAEWRLMVLVGQTAMLVPLLPRVILEILIVPVALRVAVRTEARLLLPR